MQEIFNKKVRSVQLPDYSAFKSNAILTITEWQNEEGYTVDLDGQLFNMTWSDWEALQNGMTMIRNDFEIKED